MKSKFLSCIFFIFKKFYHYPGLHTDLYKLSIRTLLDITVYLSEKKKKTEERYDRSRYLWSRFVRQWKYLHVTLLPTKSTSTVKHGACFFVSLILTHLAICAVFRAFTRLSGPISRYISLSSADTPSMANSSKKCSCNIKEQECYKI